MIALGGKFDGTFLPSPPKLDEKGVRFLATENRRESKQIKFRVTQEEYVRLEQMAETLNTSVPMLAKDAAQKKRIKAPLIDRQGAIEIAKELRAIGTNINQITRAVNTKDLIDYDIGNVLLDELGDLRNEMGKLWQLLK
ncbi:MobC family plasmid mobilization relaxosome protein [Enterococcus durans]|nr:MobC family plasmid mobilization relaxosome protein [Enterococcus durans]